MKHIHVRDCAGDCVSWCPACGPPCKHGENSYTCKKCRLCLAIRELEEAIEDDFVERNGTYPFGSVQKWNRRSVLRAHISLLRVAREAL